MRKLMFSLAGSGWQIVNVQILPSRPSIETAHLENASGDEGANDIACAQCCPKPC